AVGGELEAGRGVPCDAQYAGDARSGGVSFGSGGDCLPTRERLGYGALRMSQAGGADGSGDLRTHTFTTDCRRLMVRADGDDPAAALRRERGQAQIVR